MLEQKQDFSDEEEEESEVSLKKEEEDSTAESEGAKEREELDRTVSHPRKMQPSPVAYHL